MTEEEQSVLDPLTVETTKFTEHLSAYPENNGGVDVHLIDALRRITTSVGKILCKNANNKIVDPNEMMFIKSDDLRYIKRIYKCSRCDRDLDMFEESVSLHLAKGCSKAPEEVMKEPLPEESSSNETEIQKVLPKRTVRGLRQKNWKIPKLKRNAVKFLSRNDSDFNAFLKQHREIGEKLQCSGDSAIIESDLSEMIKISMPKQSFKLYKYGARMAGTGTKSSYLYIYVDIGETFSVYENRPSKATLNKLKQVAKTISQQSGIWRRQVPIDKGHMPTLKASHHKTFITCSISFSNSVGYINTKLMKFLFSLQPIALSMCLFMEKWLDVIDMKKAFSSHCIYLMVIFYLQNIKFLPPLSTFFDKIDIKSALNVGPWLASYEPLSLSELGIQKADPAKLMEYIMGFFGFYYVFEYHKSLICPYTGVAVEKDELYSSMPERYKSYIDSGDDLKLITLKPLVIQDPIQLNENVAQDVSHEKLKEFIQLLTESQKCIYFRRYQGDTDQSESE